MWHRLDTGPLSGLISVAGQAETPNINFYFHPNKSHYQEHPPCFSHDTRAPLPPAALPQSAGETRLSQARPRKGKVGPAQTRLGPHFPSFSVGALTPDARDPPDLCGGVEPAVGTRVGSLERVTPARRLESGLELQVPLSPAHVPWYLTSG